MDVRYILQGIHAANCTAGRLLLSQLEIMADVVTFVTAMSPIACSHLQGDHSPDNVKFHDISLTVHGTRHVKCYSYHACTSITVSGGGRNATVHNPKPYI